MKTNNQLVSIALATYNGEKYLPELLRSLENQTWDNIEIIASDDNSTDNTLEVLGRQLRHPIEIITNTKRLGVNGNFERSIFGCNGAYIALADQDDVWCPEKISDLMSAMQNEERKHGKDTPILIFSDLEIVDKKLECIHKSFFSLTQKSQKASQLRDFILGNHIPGCSMLLNRAAISLTLPFPKNIVIHDWWLAMVVATFGHIHYIDKAHVKYRQHGNNTIGAGPTTNQKNEQASSATYLPNRKKRKEARKSDLEGISKNITCLIERFEGNIPKRSKFDLELFNRACKNIFSAARFSYSSITGASTLKSIKKIYRIGKQTRIVQKLTSFGF